MEPCDNPVKHLSRLNFFATQEKTTSYADNQSIGP